MLTVPIWVYCVFSFCAGWVLCHLWWTFWDTYTSEILTYQKERFDQRHEYQRQVHEGHLDGSHSSHTDG